MKTPVRIAVNPPIPPPSVPQSEPGEVRGSIESKEPYSMSAAQNDALSSRAMLFDIVTTHPDARATVHPSAAHRARNAEAISAGERFVQLSAIGVPLSVKCAPSTQRPIAVSPAGERAKGRQGRTATITAAARVAIFHALSHALSWSR